MSPVLPSISADAPPFDECLQEQAALWFARLRSDEVSDAERAAFATWLEADSRHRREFDVLEQVWNATERLGPQAIDKPRRRRVLRAAAGLAGIAFVCGWLSWTWLDGRMTTDTGERRHVRLDDGSELDIAPDTRLRVRFDSALRRLELDEGQIVVSVAVDPQRPFEVAAGGGIIRDIGTRFEVDAGRERTRVTVTEGMVEINLPAVAAAARIVGAGETAEFDGREVSLTRPATAAALDWTKGRLVFDAAPLAEVAAALNRYRRIPIELGDPAMGAIRISGVFLIDDEAAVLRAIERVAPVKFVPNAASVQAWPAGAEAKLR